LGGGLHGKENGAFKLHRIGRGGGVGSIIGELPRNHVLDPHDELHIGDEFAKVDEFQNYPFSSSPMSITVSASYVSLTFSFQGFPSPI
jgi:hypothetical protein